MCILDLTPVLIHDVTSAFMQQDEDQRSAVVTGLETDKELEEKKGEQVEQMEKNSLKLMVNIGGLVGRKIQKQRERGKKSRP